MGENSSVLYRQLDLAHRLLRDKQHASSSTIDSADFGDSVGLPDVFYVDSGAGSNSNDGRDPAFPLATIDAAINKCTASQGDVILVQPGHAETLSAQISLDVIGVAIIGVGEGTLKPQLTIAFAGDGIDIGAANCRVENIGFAASTSGATSQINIDAANATIDGVHFNIGASDILGTITITASGEVPTIENCTVIVTANGADEWILFEGVVDRPRIEDNHVVCSDGTDGFDEGTIGGGSVAVTNATVKGNTFLGGGVAVPTLVNIGSWVGQAIGPNSYADGASPADDVSFGAWYRVVNEVTFSTADTGDSDAASGEHRVFDVTGLVEVKLTCYSTSGPTNSASDIAFGVTGAVTLIAATPEQDIDTDEIWYDTTPDGLIVAPATGQFQRILSGHNIGYAITTADAADGNMIFICEWRPLSENGNVVASTIGAAATI